MSGIGSLGNYGMHHLLPSQDSGVTDLGQKPVLKTEQEKKTWQTSLKFEAVFLQQMLSSMHKSTPKSGFLPSGFAENVHKSMMDQAVAKEASRSDSLGLAPNIYRVLEHQSHAQVQPVSGDTLRIDSNGAKRGERHGAD